MQGGVFFLGGAELALQFFLAGAGLLRFFAGLFQDVPQFPEGQFLVLDQELFLLAQFFRSKKGMEPDWNLRDLAKIYTEIEIVNMCFHKRISGIHIEDAGLNALFHLDCYAQFTNRLLLEEGLEQIEKFFSAYLSPSSS